MEHVPSSVEIPTCRLKIAEYRTASLPELVGNPLIEALPPFRAASELIRAFRRYPRITPDESKFPKAERMLAVQRINGYLEMMPCHFEVVDQIGTIIRSGYVHRNPLDNAYRASQNRFYHQAMKGEIVPIETPGPSTAPSFGVFGYSGVGKTSVVDQALSFLPQALCHKDHGFVQVVWLKVDCPPDGSLKQLLLQILANIDTLIGTQYRETARPTTTVDHLIGQVAKLSSRHHLGVLVIDEIQHLLDASGVGQSKMLNFFVTFANVVKIPVITIGTTRALRLLQGTFREARRVGDHGAEVWGPIPDGEEWMFFLQGLFRFQWTQERTELTQNIAAGLRRLTCGIHALAVRLFQLTQVRAIRTDTERLTMELFEEVARAKFKLIEPMLNALRTGDTNAIEKYEDLLTSGLTRLKDDVDAEAKLGLLKEHARAAAQEPIQRTRAVSALIDLGFQEASATDLVGRLFKNNSNLSADLAVRMVLEAKNDEAAPMDAALVQSLKDIVEAGRCEGIKPREALDAAGVVHSIRTRT